MNDFYAEISTMIAANDDHIDTDIAEIAAAAVADYDDDDNVGDGDGKETVIIIYSMDPTI